MVSNFYYYFKSALTGEECDAIIDLGQYLIKENKSKGFPTTAVTGGRAEKNLDNKPSEEIIDNLIFKINKQGWHTFSNSWKDENVVNSLRGITIKKEEINNSPYEKISEILMHLIQSGLNIEIDYDLIESYVKTYLPKKNDDKKLSNKEIKFINNYIDNRIE